MTGDQSRLYRTPEGRSRRRSVARSGYCDHLSAKPCKSLTCGDSSFAVFRRRCGRPGPTQEVDLATCLVRAKSQYSRREGRHAERPGRTPKVQQCRRSRKRETRGADIVQDPCWRWDLSDKRDDSAGTCPEVGPVIAGIGGIRGRGRVGSQMAGPLVEQTLRTARTVSKICREAPMRAG